MSFSVVCETKQIMRHSSNVFFWLFPRCGWMQRQAGLPVSRMQMQKYLGQLWLQLWWWFIVYARTWHMHKWVFSRGFWITCSVKSTAARCVHSMLQSPYFEFFNCGAIFHFKLDLAWWTICGEIYFQFHQLTYKLILLEPVSRTGRYTLYLMKVLHFISCFSHCIS